MATTAELEKELRATKERLARVEQTLKERGNINTAAADLDKRLRTVEDTIPAGLKRIEEAIAKIGNGTSPACIRESDRITACEKECKRISDNHEESTKHWEIEWRERKEEIDGKTTKKSLELATARLWWSVGLLFVAYGGTVVLILNRLSR